MAERKRSTQEGWLDRWIRQQNAGRSRRQSEIHDLIDVVLKAWDLTQAWPWAGTLPAVPGRRTRPALVAQDGSGPLVEEPTDLEAAALALARCNGHGASAEQIAAMLTLWRERHANVGRRGKDVPFDAALRDLAHELGLAPMSPEAVKKLRNRRLHR